MKKLYTIIWVFIIGSLLLGSCSKKEYLVDDGLHQAKVDMSTYDYLATHPQGLFDTLVYVIDHFGLKEEVNNAGTFFAPTNYSIRRLYELRLAEVRHGNENATLSLDEMMATIDVDSLKAYIYPEGAYDLSTADTEYTSIANAAGMDGFMYHKQLQPPGQWSFQPIYYLYYVKIRGEVDQVGVDGTVITPEGDFADLRILCQTQGIQTATGTVLNVLANNHFFLVDFNEPTEIIEPDWGIVFEHNITFPYDGGGYTGGTIEIDPDALAAAFDLTVGQFSSQFGSNIIFHAAEPDGTLDPNSTANHPGHWFDADGYVTGWGATAALFSEYNPSGFVFNIGQYPGQAVRGTTYVIRQAMIYDDGSGDEPIQVTFRLNVTVE